MSIRHILPLLALATAVTPLYAAEPAQPGPASASREVPAAGEAPRPPHVALVSRTGARRVKHNDDARTCLESATNGAIMKCAEKYRR